MSATMAERPRLRKAANGVEGPIVGRWASEGLSAQAERRAMIALVAVFALFFQALVPQLAAASAGLGAAPICAPMTSGTGAGGGSAPASPLPGHPCQHCVCPAVMASPPPILTVLAIAYVVERIPFTPAIRTIKPFARAPPRPPGQGPPTPNA